MRAKPALIVFRAAKQAAIWSTVTISLMATAFGQGQATPAPTGFTSSDGQAKPPKMGAASVVFDATGYWHVNMMFFRLRTPRYGPREWPAHIELNLRPTGATLTGTTADGKPVTGTTDGFHVAFTAMIEFAGSLLYADFRGEQGKNENTIHGSISLPQLQLEGNWGACRDGTKWHVRGHSCK